MKFMKRRFRELLAGDEPLIAPCAYDALSARMIEAAGFKLAGTTGYGMHGTILGVPDNGMLAFNEMVDACGKMADAVDIPILADAEGGYGNAINVIRSVRDFEKAGLAGLFIEDQALPPNCPFIREPRLISAEEMVGKIKAAADVRTDPDLMIIARTDARTVHGIGEALERAKAYEEAGADILFIESPESVEEMKQITTSFKVPVLANMVEGGRTPFLPVKELQDLGYDLVIFPTASTYLVTKALTRLMTVLKETGTTASLIPEMITFEQFNDLIGLTKIREIESIYVKGN